MVRAVDTLIIGAGQAGLALSHHLSAAGHSHVVLERGRVGERWRRERWDSLHLLTPNWLNELPGAPALDDPDGYLSRGELVDHLERYAASAPVIEGCEVTRVSPGYLVSTSLGDWRAANVVIATGDCALPRVPDLKVPTGVHAIHASAYRRPSDLPDGGVLIVGAGPSGQQLTAELLRAGRSVVLAVGRHARTPRRYRGRDVFAWLHEAGTLDTHVDEVPDIAAARQATSHAVSGANGGESLGLDKLAAMGAVVTGRLLGFSGGQARFAHDLHVNVRDADRRLARMFPDAVPPLALGTGPLAIDFSEIGTVLWATGYRREYHWLDVPVLDAAGEVVQHEGVTAAPGLYTLGMKFQRKRKSHLVGGVGEDAALLAGTILGARFASFAA
jgi:putative flavoprotein involved in K+ transport